MSNNTKVENINEKTTQVDLLFRLTSDIKLFSDEQGELYGRVLVDKRLEVWNLEDGEFEDILINRFMDAYSDKVPTKRTLNSVKRVLEMKARRNKNKEKVYTRIAQTDDAIYIDLCNEKWEVIEIKAGGWKVILNPPIYFTRSSIMKSLPYPLKGGKLDHIKQFLNFSEEEDYKLMLAWLLSTIRVNSPFPILILQGEQGSAKSTTAKILRSIIDPSGLETRSLASDEEDLAISTKNTWVLNYDNLSGLSNNMSDILCKMSTGGGISTRTLFTNREETIFRIKRP